MTINTLIPEILSCTAAEQAEIFNSMLQLPAVKESLSYLFSEFIATSELKILKRLSTVETALGLSDLEELEEPTIPEQIKQLSDRLDNAPLAPPESVELPAEPTTLDRKACALVEHLKENGEVRNNEVFLNSREIITYLQEGAPEDLRLKDVANTRQAKKDIIGRAVKLFSDTVMIVKNRSGNKVTGIALTPSAKRKYTDAC